MNSVGIVTARDEFAISYNKEALEGRVRQFRNLKFDSEFLKTAYNLKNSGTWDLEKARKELSKDENYEKYYQQILYRPFDTRFIYYCESVIERMRLDVMQHMLKPNVGFITVRKAPPNSLCNYFFVSEYIISNGAIRSDNQTH